MLSASAAAAAAVSLLLALCVASEPALLRAPAAPPPPAPPLPYQTPVQAAVLARALAQAEAASPGASSQVLGLLASNLTRSYLRTLAPSEGLDTLSAEELLSRTQSALETAELVHNFGIATEGNCGLDVTLDSGVPAPYFYNQWVLQSLGIVPVDKDNNVFTEASETRFFGFPPFANVSQPDFNTSASRPVYAAINMYRSSAGNAQCGPVAAVLSRKYVGVNAIAAPIDTGLFISVCGDGQESGWLGFHCRAWPASGGPLGVPGLMDHLLQPFLSFYNATAEAVGSENYINYNLARLLVRLLGRGTYRNPSSALALNFMENTWGYFEVNPVVTVSYPGGIKMMVGTFELWFGTEQGQRLREWCIARGWPLAWAYNPIDSMWLCSVTPGFCPLPPRKDFYEGVEQVNIRILDPEVLRLVSAGVNCTQGAEFESERAAFSARWVAVNSTIPADLPYVLRRPLVEKQWNLFTSGDGAKGTVPMLGSSLAIEPVFPGACADIDCAGVRVRDGTCVCSS